MSTVASPAVLHFCILPHKQHDFQKNLKIKWVFWFSLQLSSKDFLILRRIQRDTIINVLRFSCNIPVILGYMFLKPEDLKNVKVSSLLSLVANTGLGLVS